MATAPVCFMIGPFDAPGSEVRRWSDFVFEHLVKKCAESLGYRTFRTLDDPQPGEITVQIMRQLLNAELVVADLTYSNPNVFYELALRHSTARPFVHLAKSGTRIPFDVAPLQVIEIKAEKASEHYAMEVIEVDRIRAELTRQMRRIQDDAFDFENAVSRCFKGSAVEGRGRDPYSARMYAWETVYSHTLSRDWLTRQLPEVQRAIEEYAADQVIQKPALRGKLAEYAELERADGARYSGDVCYVVDNQTCAIEQGWATYQFPHSPPVSIQIRGCDYGDGRVQIRFTQPPRRVALGDGYAEVKAFNYSGEFKRDAGSSTLRATIAYPGVPGVCVGESTLSPRYGLG